MRQNDCQRPRDLLPRDIVPKHQGQKQDKTQFDKFGRLHIDTEDTQGQTGSVNDAAADKHQTQRAESGYAQDQRQHTGNAHL